MRWWEELLIICGISLDIFGALTCQGALIAKIEKKRLFLLCSLVAAWQLAALALGYLLSTLLGRQVDSGYEAFLGQAIAAAIFFCLGIRMLLKAWKNEWIVERREEYPGWKWFLVMAVGTGFYTLLAGVAFGFLGIHVAAVAVMTVCVSILVVVLGIYTGYRLGFEPKRKAQAAGAVLLVAAGVDVIVRYLIV